MFDLEKGQCEGQGHVCARRSEILVAMIVVREYERNRSRNEKFMANVMFVINT